MRRLLFDPKWHAARVALFVVITVASFAYAQYAFAHPLWTFDLYYFSGLVERHGSFTDTASVIAAADREHVTILKEGAFGAPSLVALFFQPISFLPLWLAHIVWAAVVGLGLVATLRKAAGKDWPLWGIALVLTPVTMLAWGVANAILLITPLLVYAYAALRDGQDKRAGIALAIAIALKLYPAFLILALIATRRWTALKWTLGTLLALGVATVAALGWDDAWTAARFTLNIGHNVYPGIQNVSFPGSFVLVYGSDLSQVVLTLTTIAAVAVIISLRKAPTHLAFAAGCTAMLLCQSMTWREYTMIAIVAALAIKDGAFSGRSRKLLILGVVLCAGTAYSPWGLETGINFVMQGLWNLTGSTDAIPPAPSITQTLGLALLTYGFVRELTKSPKPAQHLISLTKN